MIEKENLSSKKIDFDLSKSSNTVQELLKLQEIISNSNVKNIDAQEKLKLKADIDQTLENLENKVIDQNELKELRSQITLNPEKIEEFINEYKVKINKNKSENNVVTTIENADQDEDPVARWLGKIIKKIWNW